MKFETTVDSNVCCSEIIFSFIAQLNENEINRCFFQQDNATAHTQYHTLKFLNELFGERIISNGFWPPLSPDLSPPDYFLWGAAKSAVYRNNPKTIGELKTEITNYVHSITRETLVKVFANKCRRVELCPEK